MNWLQDPLPLPFPAAWMQNMVTAEIQSGGVRATVTENMMVGDVGRYPRPGG